LHILAGRLLAQSTACLLAGTVARGESDVVLVRRLRVGDHRRLIAISRVVHGDSRIVVRAEGDSFRGPKVEERFSNPNGLFE
jgi:hypothetical protein